MSGTSWNDLESLKIRSDATKELIKRMVDLGDRLNGAYPLVIQLYQTRNHPLHLQSVTCPRGVRLHCGDLRNNAMVHWICTAKRVVWNFL